MFYSGAQLFTVGAGILGFLAGYVPVTLYYTTLLFHL